MTVVKVGTPVETREPTLTVDIDPAAPLQSGKYVFQLVVRDNGGSVSDPALVTVIVLDHVKPTAVIDGPALSVPFGIGFTLTARGSQANPPATIVSYTWTLLGTGE